MIATKFGFRFDADGHQVGLSSQPDHHPPVHARGSAGESGLGGAAWPIAARRHASPAQIALAWLLARKPWVVPIPGTRRLERLEENVGAVDVELTSDDLGEIEDASSKITVHGARYPEHLERLTGR